MSTSDINKTCKDDASKSNDDGVCDVNNMLQNMSTVDTISVCAFCGKEGDEIINICNKCKMVKYCNAACKKKHRHKHKKECEEHVRLATEQAAKLHDEKLFKQPPPKEDCPICFLLLPSLSTGRVYKTCCGKVICSGCVHAPVYDDQGNEVDNQKCQFCRTPTPYTQEEAMERGMKRVELNDPIAIYNRGIYHRDGRNGYPQDHTKALELFHRAGELGYSDAYYNIGNAYANGRGVAVDEKKASHYYELAAMGGDVYSRHNLGCMEGMAGKTDRALRHFMISIRNGHVKSLEMIKQIYSADLATKEDYMKVLQFYQEYLGEVKSVQRDKAAEANDQYRYY